MQENKPRRGRKPLGDRAMTEVERQQKREAKLKEEGVRTFRMRLHPMHLGWVEQMANGSGVSTATALSNVLQAALDRYAGVMSRAQFLEVDCDNQEAAAAFIRAHLSPPPLPSFEELAAQFKKENP